MEKKEFMNKLDKLMRKKPENLTCVCVVSDINQEINKVGVHSYVSGSQAEIMATLTVSMSNNSILEEVVLDTSKFYPISKNFIQ